MTAVDCSRAAQSAGGGSDVNHRRRRRIPALVSTREPTMIRTRLALSLLLAASAPVFADGQDIDKVNGSITIDAAQQAGAEVVIPEIPPPEMKISVQRALEYIAARDSPSEIDAWLLAPADMPALDAEVIRAVCSAAVEHPGRIIAPVHGGLRGHPVLFPWPIAAEVRQLGHEEGINRLLQRHPVLELPISAATILQDVDTPEDYERLT